MIKVVYKENCNVLVDEEIMPLMSQYKWYVSKSRGKKYLKTTIYKPRKQSIYLHNLIAGERKAGHSFYFMDGNTLNLQKDNILQIPNFIHRYLRVFQFQKKSSVYRGVYFRSGKYIAQISFNKKPMYLGTFDDEKNAAICYDLKALELFKENAQTNLINNPYVLSK